MLNIIKNIENKCTIILGIFPVLFWILFASDLTNICYAQERDEPAVSFKKKLELVISNPLDTEREKEPIAIPITSIREKAPDFNDHFFRLKHQTRWIEPLDIPSQIRIIPWTAGDLKELVFQVNLAPLEKKVVELWYNPEGTGTPDYPVKTQSFEKWYTGGTNIAWENELIAYRSYNGVVDFFAKSYPHLRLHDLPPDSYHHERLWGLDPFMIGAKPGLCGVILFKDEKPIRYYGNPENLSLEYAHRAYEGGPVCTGTTVSVDSKGEFVLEETYSLFNGHYENIVNTVISKKYLESGVLIAPGMQKFDVENILLNERKGFMAFHGSPVEEYGTIGTALIWNTEDAQGIYENEGGCFVKLKPSADGMVRYLSLAVWYRGSAEQPVSREPFITMVEKLAQEFTNTVTVDIKQLQ